MNLKFFEKKFKNLSETVKIVEVFCLRRRFHLMRQSELKVRANTQFYMVDNDAQRIGGRFQTRKKQIDWLMLNFTKKEFHQIMVKCKVQQHES